MALYAQVPGGLQALRLLTTADNDGQGQVRLFTGFLKFRTVIRELVPQICMVFGNPAFFEHGAASPTYLFQIRKLNFFLRAIKM